MRTITEHQVNPVNSGITITVIDEPGAGGANHHYEVTWPMHQGGEEDLETLDILFQNGPIAESGVNGITEEVLLAIVADRLQCFQEGPYKCEKNAAALRRITEALEFLHDRTRDRMARGVEGTSAV